MRDDSGDWTSVMTEDAVKVARFRIHFEDADKGLCWLLGGRLREASQGRLQVPERRQTLR